MDGVTVTDVEAVGVTAPLDEPFGYSQSWVEERSAVLVQVEASDGTIGWGECWGPIAGTEAMVEEVFGPEIVGENPLETQRLYRRMYDRGRAAYQSTVPLPAISGIDIALWDLKGKLLDQPVSVLLGGRNREQVPAYATGHYFRKVTDLEEQYATIVEEAKRNAEALGAIKLKVGLQLLGYGSEEDVELVRHVREAVDSGTTIMVDANYAYTHPTATDVGRQLEALGVQWFEEPVAPECYREYVTLREELDLNIAGGECHGPAAIDRLLTLGGLDIVQPDVCNVGGLTPARQIVDKADKCVDVVPHVWGTPVAIAASLHLTARIENPTWLEFDRSPNPLREELAERPFDPDDDGEVFIPDDPGLGVEIDRQKVNEFSTNNGTRIGAGD